MPTLPPPPQRVAAYVLLSSKQLVVDQMSSEFLPKPSKEVLVLVHVHWWQEILACLKFEQIIMICMLNQFQLIPQSISLQSTQHYMWSDPKPPRKQAGLKAQCRISNYLQNAFHKLQGMSAKLSNKQTGLTGLTEVSACKVTLFHTSRFRAPLVHITSLLLRIRLPNWGISLPKWVSPLVATTSKTPLSMVRRDTSKVPPPKSNTRMFFSPSRLSKP